MSLPEDRDYPKAVLFDLDGTLVDSAPDIAAAVNELLSTRKLQPLDLAQVTSMIGNGMEKLVERAFAASGMPLGGADLERAQKDMLPIYLRHTTEFTKLYPGVRELLVTLQADGVALAVVTNKPQAATQDVLDHFGLSAMLGAVIGGDAVAHKKPAPDAIILALDRLGVTTADALMVGDSAADVGAARAAGVPVVLVRGGYTGVPVEKLGADALLDSIAKLPAILRDEAHRRP